MYEKYKPVEYNNRNKDSNQGFWLTNINILGSLRGRILLPYWAEINRHVN